MNGNLGFSDWIAVWTESASSEPLRTAIDSTSKPSGAVKSIHHACSSVIHFICHDADGLCLQFLFSSLLSPGYLKTLVSLRYYQLKLTPQSPTLFIPIALLDFKISSLAAVLGTHKSNCSKSTVERYLSHPRWWWRASVLSGSEMSDMVDFLWGWRGGEWEQW